MGSGYAVQRQSAYETLSFIFEVPCSIFNAIACTDVQGSVNIIFVKAPARTAPAAAG
jgi:homogentisate 1,2-dioxygenase